MNAFFHRFLVSSPAILLTLAILLAGCSNPVGPPHASLTPALTPADARIISTVSPEPPLAPTAPTSLPGPVTLTWWLPDFLAPGTAGPSGTALERELAAFSKAQGGQVQVAAMPKARYGKGGLLDLLTTAQPVAPSVLPDIVAIDMAELPALASAGLLQPLDGLVDPALLGGLYPFARQVGRFDGRTLAVPIMADVEHLIYNRERVQALPADWSQIAAGQPITYCFPLGNPQPATSGAESLPYGFVDQYLAAGGTVGEKSRELQLQEAPFLRVLSFYSQAGAAGVLPAGIYEISSLDDCWTDYAEEAAGLANVSARRYRAMGSNLKNSQFAPLPGPEGPALPVASGWALGILTTDPVRQRAAAGLLNWLLAPERASAWSQAAGWLPATPEAWSGEDAYSTFLQAQLASALPPPAAASDPIVTSQIYKAILAVTRDGALPKDVVRSIATPSEGKGG